MVAVRATKAAELSIPLPNPLYSPLVANLPGQLVLEGLTRVQHIMTLASLYGRASGE
jgi:hypothetical protein